MADRLKVGMVGVAGFGGHRRMTMRNSGLYDLVAAYDYNAAALAACAAEEHAIAAASYDELLATPGLEAMIVSTGATSHAEYSLKALAAGLHVFVEKPLCSTPEEMSQLLQRQRETGLVVGVGHTDHTTDPLSRKLKAMIDGKELGEVAAFEKTTCHNGGMMIKPGDWRGESKGNPGGMLFQCGVHALHELMFYFGPIASVYAAMRYDVHTTETADTAHCVVRFRSGLVGTLNAYHVSPYRHTLSIFGTKSNVYVDNRFFHEGSIAVTQTSHFDGKHEPHVPLTVDAVADAGLGNVKSFYNAVRNGGRPYPSLQDGALAVGAVFAATESVRTNREVALPEIV